MFVICLTACFEIRLHVYVCNLLIVQMTETGGQPDSESATAKANVLRRTQMMWDGSLGFLLIQTTRTR